MEILELTKDDYKKIEYEFQKFGETTWSKNTSWDSWLIAKLNIDNKEHDYFIAESRTNKDHLLLRRGK